MRGHPSSLLRSLARWLAHFSRLDSSTDERCTATHRTAPPHLKWRDVAKKAPEFHIPSTVHDSQADSNSAVLSLLFFFSSFYETNQADVHFLLASSASRHRRHRSTWPAWGRRSTRGVLLLAEPVRRETSPHIPHRSYPPVSFHRMGNNTPLQLVRPAHLACGELRC